MEEETLNIKEYRIEDTPLSCTWIIVGPPGSGKCLAKGTKVMLCDGSIKKVEKITTNDVLMGDDSKPRKVLSTTKGIERLYKIKQEDADDYIVNKSHILSLKVKYHPKLVFDPEKGTNTIKWAWNDEKQKKVFGNSDRESEEATDFLFSLKKLRNGEITVDIPLKKYLSLSKDEKKKYKGYKTCVELTERSYPLNPRIIACILCGERDGNIIDVKKKRCRNSDFVHTKDVNNDSHYTVLSDKVFLGYFPKKDYNELVEPFMNSPLELNLDDRLYFIKCVYDLIGEVEEGHIKISHKSSYFIKQFKSLADSCGLYSHDVKYNNGVFYIYVLCSNEQKISSKNNKIYTKSSTKIEVKKLEKGEYFGFQIDGNGRFLLGDYTVTHNTTLMENMCYYLKHVYPVARAFIGTDSGYKKFSDIFHPLFVSNYYDENEEKDHILRQRKCELENGQGYQGNYAINIIDDASDDTSIYRNKVFGGLFKLGSQHWSQLFMLGMQYCIDMPPGIRKSVSYVAIFFEPEDNERKKLYNNFGGLAGTFQNFCKLMDELTGDYTCLVFKKRTQSHEKEENIFFYKTSQLKNWKFGCKEYREWGDKRYNTKYVEQVIM